jgi:hypothetical protein
VKLPKLTKYGRQTLATSKALGISPHEASIWQIVFRHDELVEYHRPGVSTFPEGVRKLAAAVLELARDDLRSPVDLGYYRPPEYRPDPLGARAWFEDIESDSPFSLRWCCQVLRLDAEAVRKKVREAVPRLTRVAPGPSAAELALYVQ